MSNAQRETYQLPSHRDSSQPAGGATGGAAAAGGGGGAYTTSYGVQAGEASSGPTTRYICGECNEKVSLGRGDAIRCKACGHRVLYKERTKRMVQFEAR